MAGQRKFGLVVLGAGYMGQNVLEAFPHIRGAVAELDVEMHLEAVVDPNPGNLERGLILAQRQTASVRSFERLDPKTVSHLNALLTESKTYDSILIYDATPPEFHFTHMQFIGELYERGLSIYYLGEKPLLVDLDHVKDLRIRTRLDNVWCEFIEVTNPVVTGAQRFLEDSQATVLSGWFWRASTTGIRWAIGDARSGVTGGALLDKGPHDLAITNAFLQPEGFEVTAAQIPLFMLHPDAFQGGELAFLTLSGKRIAGIHTDLDHIEDLPADAHFAGTIKWAVKDSEVQIGYLFSWIGLTKGPEETAYIRSLNSLGITNDQWLDLGGQRTSKSGIHQYRDEEVRMAVLDIKIGNDDAQLICNFLEKHGRTKRFAVVKVKGETIWQYPERADETAPETTPEAHYRETKQRELASVFKKVVSHVIGGQTARDFLGRDAALLVHDALLKMQQAAYFKWGEKLRDAQRELQRRVWSAKNDSEGSL